MAFLDLVKALESIHRSMRVPKKIWVEARLRRRVEYLYTNTWNYAKFIIRKLFYEIIFH